MARSVFLSYTWTDPDPREVNEFNNLLRLRGVPIWRDRRRMTFGTYNEDRVRTGIAEECSGFALYYSRAVLDSAFIREIELPAMAARRRLGSPPPFFAGAILRRAGRFTDATDELERETDVRIGEALGEQVSDEDFAADLRHAANGLPGVYLEQNADPDADAIAVRIETRGDVPNADPALLHLCWSPPLCHDPDAHPENCWSDQLLPALADLHAVLDTHGARRRLGVGGNLHLSAALALGWEFREASGWTLQLEHPHVAVETTLVGPDRCGWRFVVEPGPSDGDRRLVVCLHATKDVAQAMTAHARHLPPARATLHVYPPDGRPNRQSVDPDDVNPLAAAVAAEIDTCRTRFATEQTHLYLASPWPLATVLGWNLASSGRLVMHEPDVARDSYRAACELT